MTAAAPTCPKCQSTHVRLWTFNYRRGRCLNPKCGYTGSARDFNPVTEKAKTNESSHESRRKSKLNCRQ